MPYHHRAPRDLADPTHARRSLRASVERRIAQARRRRAQRGGRSAVLVAAGLLAVGGAGAFAQERVGDDQPAATRSGGIDVAAVQSKLGVVADGVVGPQTRRAVRAFQRRNGLVVDGIIGPQTLRALGLAAATTTTSSTTTSTRTTRSASGGDLQAIAQCESGGDPTAVSPDGTYRGKYQFSRATWRALGGSGDPAAAPEAEQDRMATLLMQRQGRSAWPNCA